ncbi:MAG: tyrosine-type recombinase/integrase [Bryobacterales bacterium]|nr:tyrosine-type recombinase/integrase [Bryobacterales bacterium]
MITDLFPRTAARYLKLPLLGDVLDGLARWLAAQGFQPARICVRIRKAPVLEDMLAALGVRSLGALSHEELLSLAPRPARLQRDLSALVRSMAAYLYGSDLLLIGDPSPTALLADSYVEFLRKVRGLATATLRKHRHTARLLLESLDFDRHPSTLKELSPQRVETFVLQRAADLGRGSLQHLVSRLRSFLSFLAGRGMVRPGLAEGIDTPPAQRDERLPKALPWETIQAFLAEIDRGSPIGRRDFCMFLLMATYGLRASEVAALQLDSIRWRAGCIHPYRPKNRASLALPLTDEVGAALLNYLRHGRPRSQHRSVFLSSRRPAVPLQSPGVQCAFRRRALRSKTGISAGSHCLRHSLALHLLRSGVSVESIGGLLGHGCTATTGQYLRVHDDDLRAAALDLPQPSQEVSP